MANKNVAVFGIYATPSTAESAVDHLLSVGFANSAISVLLPDDESTRAFAHEKNTKAPEGATTGATTGGVIGGTLGLLAGIGALAIPGVGPLIAAGPIMGTLAGLGAGAATGGVVGALVGLGIPEYEAKRFEGAVKNGGTLLSVHCDTSEQIDAAKNALRDTGAKDIASASEVGSSDTSGGRSTFGNISDDATAIAGSTTGTHTTSTPLSGTHTVTSGTTVGTHTTSPLTGTSTSRPLTGTGSGTTVGVTSDLLDSDDESRRLNDPLTTRTRS